VILEKPFAAKRFIKGGQTCNVWNAATEHPRSEGAPEKLYLRLIQMFHIWLPSLCAFGAVGDSG
jgi:hypothetical protein